eukprot:200464-Pelagomonas_calceolata.AAC.7
MAARKRADKLGCTLALAAACAALGATIAGMLSRQRSKSKSDPGLLCILNPLGRLSGGQAEWRAG